MPESTLNTETLIESSGFFGTRKVLLTGRGDTALMLLYDVLDNPGGRVILPAIACPSLLATVLLSKKIPVIVDVDANLNIDPDRVREVIRPGDIVLAVHIFGIPCCIQELEKICEENNALLIEDAAQAVGGRTTDENRPLGTFGIASILSFSKGKILDTIGGGAILADDEDLLSSLRGKIAALSERPSNLAETSLLLRDALTSAFNKARMDTPGFAEMFSEVYDKHPDLYKFSITDIECASISRAFETISSGLGYRLDGVREYENQLNMEGIEFLDYPDGCVPFRFSFIMKDLSGSQTQELTNLIRAAVPDRLHVSNLYLPLHWLAPDLVVTSGCPRAEFAGTRIINLWLTDKIPDRTVDIVAKIISHYLESI